MRLQLGKTSILSENHQEHRDHRAAVLLPELNALAVIRHSAPFSRKSIEKIMFSPLM